MSLKELAFCPNRSDGHMAMHAVLITFSSITLWYLLKRTKLLYGHLCCLPRAKATTWSRQQETVVAKSRPRSSSASTIQLCGRNLIQNPSFWLLHSMLITAIATLVTSSLSISSSSSHMITLTSTVTITWAIAEMASVINWCVMHGVVMSLSLSCQPAVTARKQPATKCARRCYTSLAIAISLPGLAAAVLLLLLPDGSDIDNDSYGRLRTTYCILWSVYYAMGILLAIVQNSLINWLAPSSAHLDSLVSLQRLRLLRRLLILSICGGMSASIIYWAAPDRYRPWLFPFRLAMMLYTMWPVFYTQFPLTHPDTADLPPLSAYSGSTVTPMPFRTLSRSANADAASIGMTSDALPPSATVIEMP